MLLQLYLAVLPLAFPTQLQDFCGHLDDVLGLEAFTVLDVGNQLVPSTDRLLFINLVADCKLFTAFLLSYQQHLTYNILIQLLDDPHAAI